MSGHRFRCQVEGGGVWSEWLAHGSGVRKAHMVDDHEFSRVLPLELVANGGVLVEPVLVSRRSGLGVHADLELMPGPALEGATVGKGWREGDLEEGNEGGARRKPETFLIHLPMALVLMVEASVIEAMFVGDPDR